MEAQMIQNESDSAAQTAAVNAIPASYEAVKNGLRLEAEEGYLKLTHNGALISAAPLPSPAFYIPPTAISADKSISVLVGQTADLHAGVTPAATSLKKRFSSSDETVAAVDRYGVVTGKTLGRATVTMQCGSLSRTAAVRVDESVLPSQVLLGGYGMTEDNTIHLYHQNATRIWIIPESGFAVPAGCTATVTLAAAARANYKLDVVFIVRDKSAQEPVHTVIKETTMSADIYDAIIVQRDAIASAH
jgi:hypothetical protein